ncbi:MAG: glycine zipper 2TM domain-containing protein [Betaproteobacteria bacterium]|nr:glycine zipper 2TM domain-containing protein [Betaproteobacteria bacterium]
MSDTPSKVSPIVGIAAVSVIVFSAVGVAVMTGIIPSSFSRSEQPVVVAPQPQKAPVANTAPAERQQQKAAAAPRKAATEPTRVAAVEPARVAARACPECGTVSAVRMIEQEGEATGLGAVAGGVAGGVLGNQVGSGSGRKIATVAGAAGGAYAGHQVEKHLKKSKRWDVAVRMEDGANRTFSFDAEPAFGVGAKVRVVNGTLVAN